MAYIKNPTTASAEVEAFAYSAAQSALPAPARSNTIQMDVTRTCAAAQTDVLMAANRATLSISYKNAVSSAAALTITPNGSDTIDGGASYVLQPGDAVTLTNTTAASPGNWSVS